MKQIGPRCKTAALALVLLVTASCASSDSGDQAAIAENSEPILAATPTPPAATSAPAPTPSPEPEPTAQPTATPEPTAVVEQEPLFELEGELDLTTNELNDMIRFVEQETGRPFLTPPMIEVATSAGTGIVLESETAEDDAELRASLTLRIRKMQALGQTQQSVSEAIDNWLGEFASGDFVSGAYNYRTDVLLVPKQVPGFIVVHELVHAIDDQYVDLSDTSLTDEANASGNFERVSALNYVIEGRATSAQVAWLTANEDPEPAADADAEVDPAFLAEFPLPLAIGIHLQYWQGATFIDARGGVAATWELLREPPIATEQIFLPDITDEPVIDVPFPPADGPILEQRSFGALDMVLWSVPSAEQTVPLTRSWGGGASTMWGDANETCIRIALAGDNESDLRRLAGVYGVWAQQNDDRTTTVEGDLLFITSCAPHVP